MRLLGFRRLVALAFANSGKLLDPLLCAREQLPRLGDVQTGEIAARDIAALNESVARGTGCRYRAHMPLVSIINDHPTEDLSNIKGLQVSGTFIRPAVKKDNGAFPGVQHDQEVCAVVLAVLPPHVLQHLLIGQGIQDQRHLLEPVPLGGLYAVMTEREFVPLAFRPRDDAGPETNVFD